MQLHRNSGTCPWHKLSEAHRNSYRSVGNSESVVNTSDTMTDKHSTSASKAVPPPPSPPPATKKKHWRKKQKEEQDLFSAAEHARFAKIREAKTSNAGLNTQAQNAEHIFVCVQISFHIFGLNFEHIQACKCTHLAKYLIFYVLACPPVQRSMPRRRVIFLIRSPRSTRKHMLR